jgi:hypothetical protein
VAAALDALLQMVCDRHSGCLLWAKAHQQQQQLLLAAPRHHICTGDLLLMMLLLDVLLAQSKCPYAEQQLLLQLQL